MQDVADDYTTLDGGKTATIKFGLGHHKGWKSYNGEVDGKELSGKGTITWHNGCVYEG